MHRTLAVAVAAELAVLSAGCTMLSGGDGPSARAELEPTRGNGARGEITFTQVGKRVVVTGVVTGLKPNQEHGFHVHERGDCSSGDGMSTGGHFNPLGKPHAHHSTSERHAGDLPALRPDANGRAVYRADMDLIAVAAGPTSIVGKGLIVHADPDDYKTQPTGNSGARIACAVIRMR